MLPLFTNPLAFWGLLALPFLVAIYLLRSRYHRYPVSSLMLWLEPQETRQGGTRIDRLLTSLLFFLELLALTLLVFAAANPQLRLSQSVRPLIVVLDDSFSMQAGGEDSPRNRAIQALEEELNRHARHSVRFLLAGDTIQTMGETAQTTPETLDRLRDWRCRAASSQLEETLSFASELGGELPLLLVLTDRPPPVELHKGRVQWWAFGQTRPNIAIVNAVRTAHEGSERCLLEIANFSDKPGETSLLIETSNPTVQMQRSMLRLQPRETHRVILQLKEQTAALQARLDDDELAIDNRVTLLPAAGKPVRTDVRIEDKPLRELLDKVLRSTRNAIPSAERPNIVFTDQSHSPEDTTDAWLVHVLAEKDAVSYTGPFVLDRNHPLIEGLSLRGVVWGAGRTTKLDGAPLILAGNIPLLTDSETVKSTHELRLRLRPDLSTLQNSPGWPILIWNLLHWRASQMPGLSRSNLRLGDQAVQTFATPHEPVDVIYPDRSTHTLPVRDRRLVMRPDEVGVYSIQADEDPSAFAVNALSADESDLTGCVSGRWGDWLDETSLRLEYQSIAWVPLLLVLATVTVHLLLVARGRGRSNL